MSFTTMSRFERMKDMIYLQIRNKKIVLICIESVLSREAIYIVLQFIDSLSQTTSHHGLLVHAYLRIIIHTMSSEFKVLGQTSNIVRPTFVNNWKATYKFISFLRLYYLLNKGYLIQCSCYT